MLKTYVAVPSIDAQTYVAVHDRCSGYGFTKYKRKTGYHKKNGHRQQYTAVKIEKINA
mgnify:CR=1 FL=1